jgi:N6-adenosine-specific RNA methylase IME4
MPQIVNPPADWKNLEVHPIAALYPAMSDEEYETLQQDILERGQQEPILLHEGKIPDGKARNRACKELDLVPQFAEWDGDQTTLSTWLQVKGQNLVRRHLGAEQRAAILLRSAEVFPEVQQTIQVIVGAAELRKQLGIKVPKQGNVWGEAATIIGRIVGVSGSTVKRVLRVQDEHPDRLKDLAEGETTCSKVLKAEKEAAPAPEPDAAAQVVKKYQLVYADLTHGKLDKKPLLTWIDTKSALFLWTPPGRLQEAIKLLLVWGWEYKTTFVWDRGKEVELLLLATRNCPPKMYAPAKVVIKEKAPQDGGKPELFRELAATLFPQTEGSRLDLFSPVVPDGWDKEPVAADAAAA